VSETPSAQPPPATQPTPPPGSQSRTLLEIASLIALGALLFAAVVGVVAVLTADSRPEGFIVGFGIATLVFFAGAAIACALACLVRQRMEYAALAILVAACLAIDLIVLAIWLDIDSEAYGKAAGVAFVWSFFGLIALSLVLAVANPERIALALYVGAITAATVGALMSTYLVLTAGDDELSGSAGFGGPLPVGDDALFQALGAMLVILAALWFGALAASRLPNQTLNRTLTTSPSSTT
jgi:hypothetical protein